MACAGSAKKTSRSACRCVPRTNWASWPKVSTPWLGTSKASTRPSRNALTTRRARSQQKTRNWKFCTRLVPSCARQPMLIPCAAAFSTACKSRWGQAPARCACSTQARRIFALRSIPGSTPISAIAKRCCPAESVCAARRPPAKLRCSPISRRATPSLPSTPAGWPAFRGLPRHRSVSARSP